MTLVNRCRCTVHVNFGVSFSLQSPQQFYVSLFVHVTFEESAFSAGSQAAWINPMTFVPLSTSSQGGCVCACKPRYLGKRQHSGGLSGFCGAGIKLPRMFLDTGAAVHVEIDLGRITKLDPVACRATSQLKSLQALIFSVIEHVRINLYKQSTSRSGVSELPSKPSR